MKRICSPQDGNWYETSSTTATDIAKEMNLDSTTGWSFKVNGNVRKTLGSVSESDIIEMVETTDVDEVNVTLPVPEPGEVES